MTPDKFRKLYHGYANKHDVGHAFDRDLDALLESSRAAAMEDCAKELDRQYPTNGAPAYYVRALIGKEGENG